MKKIISFTLLLASILNLCCCACSGNEGEQVSKASLSVSPLDLTADFNTRTMTVTVTSDADWGVSIEGAPDWVSVFPSGGVSGTSEITFTFSENKGLEARSAKVLYKAGSTRKEAVITQGFDENSEIVVPEGYKLVWQEEFDEGDCPNTDKWWYETGGGGWGNNEVQTYVSQTTPSGTNIAKVEKGALTISTVKENGTVYSIRVNTKDAWQYGWFEARIKVSEDAGSWPAFWMMPKNYTTWPGDGEIDIMEYAISTQGKDKSSSSIHCNAYNWPKGTQKTHVQSVKGAATEFHVYALEWTAEQMVFYVDGTPHLTFRNNGGGYDYWPFNAPFYLKLNMAYGGNMGGNRDENALPAEYQIDYVRVFQKK